MTDSQRPGKTLYRLDTAQVDQCPMACLLATAEGEVLAANALAGPLEEAIAQGHTPEVLGYIGRAALTGKPMAESILLPGPQGPIYFELTLMPMAEPDTVLVLGREVTLERNLRVALVESRQRYKDLVEISSDFSWETGLDGRFVFVTPRGAMGYSADELVGRDPARLIDPGHEEEGKVFSARHPTEDVEIWMRTAQGQPICVQVSAAPLIGPAGEWRGARGVCRDITDMRERDAALARAANRERLLTYIVRTIRDEVEPGNMLQAAAEATARALSAQGCRIYRVESGRHRTAAGFGTFGEGPIDRALDAALEGGAQTFEFEQDGWQVMAALTRYHGQVNGAIALARPSPLWHDDERILITDVANQIGIANEQIANHERILNLSRTDALTGLFNRRAFFEEAIRRFNRLDRDQKSAALLYVDLDNFKMVNDVRGHQAGDQALIAVRDLLVGNTRPIDLVARLGGDEFAIWLEGADVSVAEKRAQALLGAFTSLLPLSGTPEKPLGASLGVAVHLPDHPERFEELVARADETMYEVKRHGKGSYRLSVPSVVRERAE
ncbi:MAG: diguanylate cyclase [Rhodospirillales bacterium]|nr:diguanylate cyclase [Rhodospirillales bacterium]